MLIFDLSHRSIMSDRSGNFGLMTALILPMLLGGAGLAIDTANLMVSKRQLQEATDAAALAVSGAMANGSDSASDQKLGKDFLAGQLANPVYRFFRRPNLSRICRQQHDIRHRQRHGR